MGMKLWTMHANAYKHLDLGPAIGLVLRGVRVHYTSNGVIWLIIVYAVLK